MTLALIDRRRALCGRFPNPYDVAQCRARPDQPELEDAAAIERPGEAHDFDSSPALPRSFVV
jgi:hypothetical protein